MQYTAFRALVNLFYSDEEQNKSLGLAGAAGLLCRGLEEFSDDRHLQCYGLRAVGHLAYQNPENAAKLMAAEAAELVMAGVTRFATDRDVQLYGLWAVLSLGSDNPANVDKFLQLGACESVIRNLYNPLFAKDAEINRYACRAAGVLANQEVGKEKLTTLGAAKKVLEVLSCFGSDVATQGYGLVLMGQLASIPGNLDVLVVGNALGKIVSAMSAFGSDHVVLQGVMRCVAYFAANASYRKILVLAARDLCAKLAAAVIASPSDYEVNYYGYKACAELLQELPEMKKALGAMGICGALESAITAFPYRVELQRCVCKLVAELSTEDINKFYLRGALKNIIEGPLVSFPSDYEIQAYGLQCIGQLYVGQYLVSLGETAPAVDRVMAALNTFPSSRDVLSFGCLAISALIQANKGNGKKFGPAACTKVAS